jgi:hypothetical protein
VTRVTGRGVAGHPKAARPRPVRLLERVEGRWTQVAHTRTSRSGSFGFRVAAGHTGAVRSFRAEAPPKRGLHRVRSRTVEVTVRAAAPAPEDTGWESLAAGSTVAPEPLPAGYVAAGSADDWSFLLDRGGRWNPCAAVRWAYNPTGQEYPGAFADVVRAFARISGASGLQFQYVGTTPAGYLGHNEDLAAAGAGVDIVVSWATAADYARLGGSVVGVGGGSATSAPPGSDVAWRFVRGYLVLDADAGFAIPPGFDVSGWGQIMQHEILHALGLGHAQHEDQLMYGAATPTNIRFGAGDLTGMARIGAGPGCLT